MEKSIIHMICPKCNKKHSHENLEEIELSSFYNLICVECFSKKDDSNKEYIEEKERIIIEDFFNNISEYEMGIQGLRDYINNYIEESKGNNIYNKVIDIIFGEDVNIEDLKKRNLNSEDFKILFISYSRDKIINKILN